MTNVRNFKGQSPMIAKSVYVDPAAVIIGNVTIGEDCSVWPNAVLRGDINVIQIGSATNIQDGSVLHVTHAGPYCEKGYSLIIGDDVTVGHNATLHGWAIENRVLVGMGAIILDNVTIPSDVLIGAGALVTPKLKLKSGYLYAGSPAKEVRQLNDDELSFLKYSANHYVKLKLSYMQAN